MATIIILLALGIVAGSALGLYASFKDMKGWLWFWYGFLLPVVALAHMFIIQADPGVEYRRELALDREQRKRCSACYEMVRKEARKCRYCGSLFLESDAPEKRRSFALPGSKGHPTS